MILVYHGDRHSFDFSQRATVTIESAVVIHDIDSQGYENRWTSARWTYVLPEE